jgi:hypothetical protein
MNNQQLSYGFTLVVLVSLFLLPGTTTAQTGFPIGLTFEYEIVSTVDYYYPAEFHIFYEVMGWSAYADPDILQMKSSVDYSNTPASLFWFNLSTWQYSSAYGEETSQFVFPRFWVMLTTLLPGGTVEHNITLSETLEFSVTASIPVTVPAGTFTCWWLHNNYTSGPNSYETNLYYETSIGLLIKVDYFNNYTPGTYGNDFYTWDLVSSNFGGLGILRSPSSLVLVGGIAAIVVVAILVVFYVWRRQRRG